MKPNVLRALARVLLPIATFLLRAGVSYKEFEALAKRAYIHSALEEFSRRNRDASSTRVSVFTGLPRREVSALKNDIEAFSSVEDSQDPWVGINRPGDVLTGWFTDPGFSETPGSPNALNSNAEFALLAKKYAPGVPVRALLSELISSGVVRYDSDGKLVPSQRYFVPKADADKLTTSLNFNLYSLASTIAHNSDPIRSEQGHIERFVGSDRIPVTYADTVRSELREMVERFSYEIDDFLARYEERNASARTHLTNVGVGLFYYEQSSYEEKTPHADHPDES